MMKAVKFSESITMDADSVFVFDFTQDYNRRLEWDTFLILAELKSNATQAEKGIKAWCVAKNGFGMETEYVSFNRPKVTAIKMTKGPYIFKSFLGSWSFQQQENGITKVTFLYSFELRFPFYWFGAWIKKNLQKNVRQRLADLKKAVEDDAKSKKIPR